MSVEFDVGDVLRAGRDLADEGKAIGGRLLGVARTFGQRLQTTVQGNASGRPGPRAQTGDYRRLIGWTAGLEAGAAVARAGTNKPQGRRLELGFVGVDSLGRHYNQPPFPHFGPAVDQLEGPFAEAVDHEAVR